MLKINNSSKIFVMCVGNVVTGGAELLHQLVDKLNRIGLDAYIYYYDTDDAVIPEAYSNYNVNVTTAIEDKSENIVVFYEACFHLLKDIKHAQPLLWWLSVDNFYICSSLYLNLIDLLLFDRRQFIIGLYLRLKSRKSFMKSLKYGFSIRSLTKIDALNGYQSEYAQNFLINKGFKCTAPLSDYINTQFSNCSLQENRRDIILYNPKKGLAFTKKIIEFMRNWTFVPIQNLSRQEIVELMSTSKLYLDFGYHPGKDRLPREAALMGCCVITGMRGSARFFEDICINNQYKFDERKDRLESIAKQIENVMSDYPSHIQNFEGYRQKIMAEKSLFERDVEGCFRSNKLMA